MTIDVLKAASYIAILGGAMAYVVKWISPLLTMKSKVAEHEKEIKELKQMQKMVLKSQFALISHEINGNSIDKLKEAQKDLQDLLIDK